MSSGSSTRSVQAEFPVVWDDSVDAARSWRLDRMHHPDPIAPLDFWLFRDVVAQGIMAAGRALDLRARRINTYLYLSAAPPALPDAEAVKQMIADTLGVQALWSERIFPEVEENLRWWGSVDPASLSDGDFLAHLAETVERAKRVWVLHFRITQPAFAAVVELTDLYRGVCGGTDLDAFRLVQGFGNKTLEAGREMWRLGRVALEHGEVPAADLDAFLRAYGRRSNGFGIAYPSWIEDPSAPLETIRRFASQTRDPYADLERLADERESAVAAARRRFAKASDEDRMRFEALLPAAQAGIVITEDHGFYIDFATNYEIRRVFVDAGRRLVEAGAFALRSDVAMLELEEIVGALRGGSGAGLGELVDERRDEMERFSSVHPPEFLGVPAPDPATGDDLRARFVRRFYGPANAGLSDGVLVGAPGAPGKARGVARLVLDLDAADRLGPDEILVTRTTTPAWTPLFAVAGAVVTDGGGQLSHCAIVAREYGIPAVVGTMTGTVSISDGQTVEVDGDQGVVRIVG